MIKVISEGEQLTLVQEGKEPEDNLEEIKKFCQVIMNLWMMVNQILQMEKQEDVDLVGTIIEALQEDQQNSKMEDFDLEEDVRQ